MSSRQKRPVEDEVIDWMGRSWKWLESHWKPVSLVALIVVVVVSASVIVVKYQKRRNLDIQIEYYEIMKAQDESARASELEDFAKRRAGKDASFLAYMWLGSYYHKKGDLEKAAEFYNKVVGSAKGKLIYFMAVDALTPVYFDLGKFGEAGELSIEAADIKSSPHPYLYKLKAAAGFELSGDLEKASEIYENLMADENTPPTIKLKAEEQLLWITALK